MDIRKAVSDFAGRVFEKRSLTVAPLTAIGLPYGFSQSPLSLQTAMQLSTVYRCVEVISDSIATQTWDISEYQSDKGWVKNPFHKAAYMLNFEPNPAMSRYIFMKTLVAKILLEGNGYAIIHRDSRGDPYRLELVNESVIPFIRKDGTIYYEVGQQGYTRVVDGSDMIHIQNFTYDGLVGVSTLRHAATSMGLSYSAEATAKGFFSSGANMSGIITAGAGKLTQERASAIKDSWSAAFNVTSGNPGGVAVMESGMEFKPVTVNPKDAQMLETRQFNVLEICRFFGVPPSKVFDQAGLTYSNVEAYQLGFITDTVTPLDSKVEAEFNRKLLRPSQRSKVLLNLNLDELIKANLDTKANYLSKMFQCGGMTVNEVRESIGNERKEGGDEACIQVNMIPISKVIAPVKPIKEPKPETQPTDG